MRVGRVTPIGLGVLVRLVCDTHLNQDAGGGKSHFHFVELAEHSSGIITFVEEGRSRHGSGSMLIGR
jgi:hypothetical protein